MEERRSSDGDSDFDIEGSEYSSDTCDSPPDLSLSCSFSPFESGESDDTHEATEDTEGIEPYLYEPDASSSDDLPGDEESDGDPSRLLNTDWLVRL